MVFAGPGWDLLQDGDAVWMIAAPREAAHTTAQTQTLVVRLQAEESRAQDGPSVIQTDRQIYVRPIVGKAGGIERRCTQQGFYVV